jgi:hypothetical protein
LSDNYLALVDTEATAAQAADLAARTIACLRRNRLIESELSADCVLGGEGFPAGPRCSQVYVPSNGEGLFWTLVTSGVEIHAAPWVNEMGATVFEAATCPRCGHIHDEKFLDQFAELWTRYKADHEIPEAACSACGVSTRIHEWTCVPHLGFVNFAVVFWNWPPFHVAGWRLDIPSMLQKELNRALVATYGHV